MFPLEQSTILITVGKVRVAGLLPIAVTIRLKDKVASLFVTNSILSLSTIVAPEPEME